MKAKHGSESKQKNDWSLVNYDDLTAGLEKGPARKPALAFMIKVKCHHEFSGCQVRKVFSNN